MSKTGSTPSPVKGEKLSSTKRKNKIRIQSDKEMSPKPRRSKWSQIFSPVLSRRRKTEERSNSLLDERDPEEGRTEAEGKQQRIAGRSSKKTAAIRKKRSTNTDSFDSLTDGAGAGTESDERTLDSENENTECDDVFASKSSPSAQQLQTELKSSESPCNMNEESYVTVADKKLDPQSGRFVISPPESSEASDKPSQAAEGKGVCKGAASSKPTKKKLRKDRTLSREIYDIINSMGTEGHIGISTICEDYTEDHTSRTPPERNSAHLLMSSNLSAPAEVRSFHSDSALNVSSTRSTEDCGLKGPLLLLTDDRRGHSSSSPQPIQRGAMFDTSGDSSSDVEPNAPTYDGESATQSSLDWGENRLNRKRLRMRSELCEGAPSRTVVSTSFKEKYLTSPVMRRNNSLSPSEEGSDGVILMSPMYADVVWDRVTVEDDELSFRVGDVIEILDMTDDIWWHGSVHEDSGWFPSTFVRLRIGQESDSEDTTPEVTKPEQPDPVPHLRLNHPPTRSGSSIRRRMTIRRKDSAPEVPKKLPYEETAKKLFDEAMKKGYVESRAIVLLLVGAAGVGKSSFKHLILRLSLPAVRQSTPLAEAAIRAISICRAIIGGEDTEWQRVKSEEMLRRIADAIKAGVSFRSLSPISFPLRVLPHDADNSDLTPTKETTQPDESSSQPSSDTQHSVPPSQIQLEEEIVDLISQSSGSKKILDVDWVYIVDSGGQPQFLEMLPAFIRYASACVFVTRLDESLTDHPTIEYYGQGGQRHGPPYRSLLTHEQILQHCSQAFQSRRCTSSSPQSGPMVFVAGTHKDLEHDCPETRSAKNKKLLESLRPVFHNKLGLYRGGNPDQLIFPVNAKTPHREDEMVASEFRKIVTTSCPHKREQIPIPWFVLEQFIRQYAAEKKVHIVSIKECRQIAQRLRMNDKNFLAALDYLVALNIFHYYPTILPNVLFCDTQVLLDKISELVEYSHVLRSRSGTLCTGDWLRFRDEGIITDTVDCLEEFPKHYVADFFTASDLLKLLQALFIIAHLAESEYFMPSLLRELQPEELNSYRCCLTTVPSPLLVHYPGGCLPSGIFTSLIAYLQNDRSWKLFFNRDGKPACLHKNCIKFERPDGEPGSVTLIDSFTHFEVHLTSCTSVSPRLCSEIHRDIFDGLEKAAHALSYSNLHPKGAVFCSGRGKDCKPTPHPAEVGADRQSWRCLTDKEFGGKLTEGQTLWFSASERVKGSGTVCPWIDLELSMKNVTNALKCVTAWHKLGIQLDVPVNELSEIESNYPRDNSRCKSEMLSYWFNNAEEQSWVVIADALKRIDHRKLANEIQGHPSKDVTSSETVEHTSSVADGESVRPRKAHMQQKEDCPVVPGAARSSPSVPSSPVQSKRSPYSQYFCYLFVMITAAVGVVGIILWSALSLSPPLMQ